MLESEQKWSLRATSNTTVGKWDAILGIVGGPILGIIGWDNGAIWLWPVGIFMYYVASKCCKMDALAMKAETEAIEAEVARAANELKGKDG